MGSLACGSPLMSREGRREFLAKQVHSEQVAASEALGFRPATIVTHWAPEHTYGADS